MTDDRPTFQRRSPKQARSRVTWEAIVEAASQILERHGPDALNTNSVAERAGVSIGTLYQYFPDKQAILLAAAKREVSGVGELLPTRQRALIRALIDAVETIGRLGGGSVLRTAKSRSTDIAASARRTRRGPTWERRCAELFRRLLIELAAPIEPDLARIPIRTHRR